MSHNYTQASTQENKYYKISLDGIIEGAGITRYKSLSNNIREIEKALDELVKKITLRTYKTEKLFDVKNKRKIVGAIFKLYPSKKFVSDTIMGNTKMKIPNRTKGFRQLMERQERITTRPPENHGLGAVVGSHET